MKFYKLILLFLFLAQLCRAQDTTIVIHKSWIDKPTDAIYFMNGDGWVFKQGNDTGFEKINTTTKGWKKLKPAELSSQYADKNGRVEGWFRLNMILDSSLRRQQPGFDFNPYAATELFIDGKLIATRGNTGNDGKPFREYNGGLDPVIVEGLSTSPHLVAIHFVSYLSPMPPHDLKIWAGGIVFLTGPNYANFHSALIENKSNVNYLVSSACVLLSILFWLLFFQNKQEKNLFWIALFTTVLTLVGILQIAGSQTGIIYIQSVVYRYLGGYLVFFEVLVLIPILITKVFNRKLNKKLMLLLISLAVLNSIGTFFRQWNAFGNIAGLISIPAVLLVCIYYLVTSWKSLKGAQWAIVSGLLFFISTILINLILLVTFKNLAYSESFNNFFTVLTVLSFPLSLLVYVSMRFKEIVNEVKVNAGKVIELSEEKKLYAENRQKILQEEVNIQTAELRSTLQHLQSTQSQLIQSEKMASLGELTAGIAHEIQNPLNFVNNFSEVSNELIDEMKEELATGNQQQAIELADDIKQNLEKIVHHGKRADAIVKGMLQHSRSSSGQKEPTDINALCDEYLRLAYHGLRAKDKSFNAAFTTAFDDSLSADEAGVGKINIIPQDIGRVMLNLITNAFYAVNEKKNQIPDGYEPMVSISTKRINDSVEIQVTDNANGIPQNVIAKIFQPFFTTKPTGQGTGLGLSMSYDIVKAHGGDLNVETEEGAGTTFFFNLSAG